MALYDPQQHRSHTFLYGFNPRVACLCYEIWILWLLGYPDRALQRSREALTLARELAYPFSLAYARDYAAVFHMFRREVRAVQKWAEAAITLSTEQGFPYWSASGTILRGWALAEQGQAEEGIAQMCQGVAAHLATGAEMARPSHLTLLAEAYEEVGQAEEGLSALSEALTLVNKTGEHWYQAELYRLKGTLTLQSKAGLGQVSDKSQTGQDRSEDTDP